MTRCSSISLVERFDVFCDVGVSPLSVLHVVQALREATCDHLRVEAHHLRKGVMPPNKIPSPRLLTW